MYRWLCLEELAQHWTIFGISTEAQAADKTAVVDYDFDLYIKLW